MLKLASSIGLALALADLKARLRRLAAQGVLALIGLALLMIGVCFLLVAAHLYLSEVLSPVASAAIIGGALVFLALIFFLAAQMKGRPQAARPTAAAGEGVARLGDAIGPNPLANPTLLMAAAAVLLGFMFGRRTKRGDEKRDD
jgi:hypothetical protein